MENQEKKQPPLFKGTDPVMLFRGGRGIGRSYSLKQQQAIRSLVDLGYTTEEAERAVGVPVRFTGK